jgi:adenosylcobinamide-GDP ribazoletransferase
MLGAIAFLTALGRPVEPTRESSAWFPVVGLLVGLAVGAVWAGARHVLPALVAAAVVVGADALLTGGLHLDGLADAADGLLAPMGRAKRLEVMRDPAIGAFGAVALGLVLLVRFAVFASGPVAPLVVGGIWGTARAGMAVALRTLPYARPEGGLADRFVGRPAGRAGTLVLFAGTAACVGVAVLGRHERALVVLAAVVLAFVAVVLFARRRLGGFTGDVLGAAGVVGETVGLLVLTVRWR